MKADTHLIVDSGLIEGYIYGVGGGVVVRAQERLFIRLVPHHEVHNSSRRLEEGREQRDMKGCLKELHA